MERDQGSAAHSANSIVEERGISKGGDTGAATALIFEVVITPWSFMACLDPDSQPPATPAIHD